MEEAVLIPHCVFLSSLQRQLASDGVACDLLDKLVEYLDQEIREHEPQKIIIISTTPQTTEKAIDRFSEKILSIFKETSIHIHLLQNLHKLEEILLSSKNIIDEHIIQNIKLIVPKSSKNFCSLVMGLVFNEHSYHIDFKEIEDNLVEDKITTAESALINVRQALHSLPPPDQLPVETLTSPIIPSDLFYHGYTTRTGGCSTFSTMKSLSLVYSRRKKDTHIFVDENRCRLAASVGFNYQYFKMASAIHGTDVWVIGDQEPDTYDAIVTNKENFTIAAPGADCQTLLFCDPKNKVIGAAHSGWKGTIDRIQQNVVKTMIKRFGCDPKNITVAIGPSIGVCCYNVNEERAEQFIQGVDKSSVVFKGGVPFLDLWHVTGVLLQQVGIRKENIDDGKRFTADELNGKDKVTQCTQCNPAKFFSFRRDGGIFGNQCGFIGIKKI